MEAGGCSFAARVTADYGDHVYQFAMDCRADPEQTRLEVTQPPELAGIGATVRQNDTKIRFDDVELDFGQLGHGLTPPVGSPWLLVQSWIGEYIAFTGTEDELLRVTYLRGFEDEEIQVDTWFDAQNVPVYAEISQNDTRYLTLEISEFQF